MYTVKKILLANSDLILPIIAFTIILLLITVTNLFSPKHIITKAFKKSKTKAINNLNTKTYSKIIGHVKRTNQILTAPLSGKKCVYYKLTIDIKDKKNWKQIINDTQCLDFFVEDTSGVALITAKAINKNTCILHVTNKLRINLKPNNKKILSYFEANNKKLNSSGVLKCKELIIEQNSKIGVKGLTSWKTLKQPVTGFSYSKIMNLYGTKQKKLLITNAAKLIAKTKRAP